MCHNKILVRDKNELSEKRTNTCFYLFVCFYSADVVDTLKHREPHLHFTIEWLANYAFGALAGILLILLLM